VYHRRLDRIWGKPRSLLDVGPIAHLLCSAARSQRQFLFAAPTAHREAPLAAQVD
jgi:hypothetical protein